jgi:hypothetical protein
VSDDPLAGEKFIRCVGRRQRAPSSTANGLGQPPTAVAREAMTRMARYRTRVPKGVFIYASHEQANQDWERWRAEAMRLNSFASGDD